jgi:signal transduction histidine kinase
MIASLTHDMRSPLTAAILATDIIKRKIHDEFAQKHLRKIKVNHRRIDGLIQDLLNTAQLRAGEKLLLKPEQVKLPELLYEIRDYLPSDQEDRLHIDCPEVEGHWDRDHLKRALENLISNAFKYGDTLKEVSLKVTAQFQRVMFTVHNHGPHIPKEEQETIFQIYRRAEAAKTGKYRGWGLGLPLVRAVAESHAGSVSLDSFHDSGTTFMLDLPQDVRSYLSAKVTPQAKNS